MLFGYIDPVNITLYDTNNNYWGDIADVSTMTNTLGICRSPSAVSLTPKAMFIDDLIYRIASRY